MDIIYDVLQIGVNRFLFNYTVNSDTPVFILVFTNPWTAEEKTVTLNTPDGTDGEWIFNIEGVENEFEDLNNSLIEFENPGTWQVSVSESGNLIKNINLQVIEVEGMALLFEAKTLLTPSQINNIFSVEVDLVAAPGANKVIQPVSLFLFLDFEGVAYDTNTRLRIGWQDNDDDWMFDQANWLAAVADRYAATPSLGDSQINSDIRNKGVRITVQTGDPANGDSPVSVRLLYSIADIADIT